MLVGGPGSSVKKQRGMDQSWTKRQRYKAEKIRTTGVLVLVCETCLGKNLPQHPLVAAQILHTDEFLSDATYFVLCTQLQRVAKADYFGKICLHTVHTQRQ